MRAVGRAFHIEAVLDEGEAEASAGAVFRGVRGVQEIGKEEADELEGHADHAVPHEGEDGPDGEAVDVHFVGGHARGEDGRFPVWGCGVGGCGLVGLAVGVSALYGRLKCRGNTYGWLFFI